MNAARLGASMASRITNVSNRVVARGQLYSAASSHVRSASSETAHAAKGKRLSKTQHAMHDAPPSAAQGLESRRVDAG